MKKNANSAYQQFKDDYNSLMNSELFSVRKYAKCSKLLRSKATRRLNRMLNV